MKYVSAVGQAAEGGAAIGDDGLAGPGVFLREEACVYPVLGRLSDNELCPTNFTSFHRHSDIIVPIVRIEREYGEKHIFRGRHWLAFLLLNAAVLSNPASDPSQTAKRFPSSVLS